MGFSTRVKEDALVSCGRHCCLCHKFCNLKIEVHHIIHTSEGGKNTFDNAIPLCLDCHADMRSYDHKHPKGTKYTPCELKRHRDLWYEKVKGSPAPQYDQKSIELDTEVFHWIMNNLPWELINWASKTVFAGFPFRSFYIDDFINFQNECQKPHYEFLDADLEGLRSQLLITIIKFTREISLNTWQTNNPEWLSVPPEWKLEQPERFKEVVENIHSYGKNIYICYSDIIRESRRRLGVKITQP